MNWWDASITPLPWLLSASVITVSSQDVKYGQKTEERTVNQSLTLSLSAEDGAWTTFFSERMCCLVNDDLMVGQCGVLKVRCSRLSTPWKLIVWGHPQEALLLLKWLHFQPTCTFRKRKQTFIHCRKVEMHPSRTGHISPWLIWDWSRIVFFFQFPGVLFSDSVVKWLNLILL
jgi:hypothetical protein